MTKERKIRILRDERLSRRFLRNVSHNTHYYNKAIVDMIKSNSECLATLLICSFSWAETPEGLWFWRFKRDEIECM